MSEVGRHLDDDTLAALADGALSESSAASARDHMKGCSDCDGRALQLDELKAQLARTPPAAPDRVEAIVEAARAQPDRPRPAWSVLLPTAVVPAGVVAIALLAVWPSASDLPSTSQAGEFTARGGPAAATTSADGAPVALRLQSGAVAALGIDGGSVVLRRGAPVSISAGVGRDLGAASTVAVFARDASGRVTWLAPTWTDPSATPTPLSTSQLDPLRFVELPPLPDGPLELTTMVVDDGASIAALDAKLEAGWKPAPDAALGVTRVVRRQIDVLAEVDASPRP